MGLRLKFNLVLFAVFLAGFAVAGYVSRTLLDRHARAQVLGEARLVMEAALAVRGYTVDKVRPHLIDRMDRQFLPQTVPAFAATETLNELRKKYSNYAYKEATLNPTNLRDRPADWEADLIHSFRNDSGRREITGQRETPTGPVLYIAHPIRIESPACLQCHSTPDAAPPSMIRIYGSANGFGWKLDEVVGAQVVSVPMSVPLANAAQAFRTFMISLAAVFAAVFVVLNLLLSWLIIRPVSRMSAAADKISTGDFDQPEFAETGNDEVAVLARSFNRMRRSLEKAMQMIDG
jgi:HAMP domain-containing protein